MSEIHAVIDSQIDKFHALALSWAVRAQESRLKYERLACEAKAKFYAEAVRTLKIGTAKWR